MSNYLTIEVPNPCQQDWGKMTPAEAGRFCDACKKQVIDFSMMNDQQLVDYFTKIPKRSNESVCGRFYSDQLNRDIQIPKKRLTWRKYFLQLLIPAFLASIKLSAQSQVTGLIG